MKKAAVIYWSGTGNTEAMANAVASIEETTARTMRLLDAGRKMEQNKVS